ncbi:MAG: DUF2459 domain-containing protein [Candidatus Tectimicrobiota bacterium]
MHTTLLRAQFLRILSVILVSLACLRCTTTSDSAPLYPLQAQETPKFIYLVGHGWHTGLVVKWDDIDERLWPEKHDFPEAHYLEVGWGDHDFYRTPKAGLCTLLQAALWSPASVLLVIGLRMPVAEYFPRADIIEIPLSRQGLDALASFVHATYARDSAGRQLPLGPGNNHPYSTFYKAEGHYSLFNTCNTWTAKALQAAGLPVRRVMQADGVMTQAQRYGRVLQLHATGRAREAGAL